MFIDEVEISVKAGKGGDGISSFRREKFVPKGGPDGGDGGRGGDIYFFTAENVDTLSYYNSRKKFKADDGKRGRNKKMYGRKADDLILKIPVGTVIYQIENQKRKKIVDLKNPDEKFLICKGGKGGLGNVHFKSATHQTPTEFTTGEKGERKHLILELRLIADIGLVGLPSVGKSSLISLISNKKAKIADYPFTTLIPNLGVVNYKKSNFTIADVPGLIKGASGGKGLGIKFLKHIKRTKALVHILSAESQDIYKDYLVIREELTKFDKSIEKKQEIVVINKVDLVNEKDLRRLIKILQTKIKVKEIYPISTKTNIGITNLLDKIIQTIDKK